MIGNAPKRHHYVPQFYLRRFACPDDGHKVMTVERHHDFLVGKRKSINHIGYEDGLHDYVHKGEPASIESDINRIIETPFARSSTWLKISTSACETLNEQDKLPIYMFARHLQRRNLETLRFIEVENERSHSEEFATSVGEEEREMHEWMSASADAGHTLFREGALDIIPPADANRINVMVCRAPIALRSSTNPTLMISHPGRESVFGFFFNSLRTWWITLDRHWGAFIIAGGPPGFTNRPMPLDAARVINRQYLVQLQNSLSVRYLIADDEHLAEDMEWAGHRFERSTTNGFRYRKNR